MKRLFLFVALMILLGGGAILCAHDYIVKPETIQESKTIKTPKGTWTVVFADGAKNVREPGRQNMVTNIYVIPPTYKHVAKSKEKFNEDWGSVPPQVKQIIYHDLEGTGKPDFCNMRYWEIKVDANGQRVREDKEMILPDDVADEILKVLLNETKWQPVTNRDWYKFVKTPELKGKYD